MKKSILGILLILFVVLSTFSFAVTAEAGWVNGYVRSDGTYVNGYYRTEPNYYKWDNLSWDGDWSDAYNDKSWYRDYGYDPEPLDNDIPNYSYWNSSSLSLPSYNYDYSLDDYSYNYDSYDYGYGSSYLDYDYGSSLLGTYGSNLYDGYGTSWDYYDW